MGNGKGEESGGSGGRSAVFKVLQRSLKIGRQADDTIKTGAWEAGWSGAKQSEKVQTIATKFDKLLQLYRRLREAIDALPEPLVGDLRDRLLALDTATAELQTRVVQNNDADRDAFLGDIKAQSRLAKALTEDCKAAAARAAARATQTITWKHPSALIPGTSVDLTLLGARTDGNGTLRLFRKGKPVTAVVINQGAGQAFEIRADESATHLASTLAIKLDALQAQRVIRWQPPAEIEWGQPVTVESLGASATGDGGPLEIHAEELATVGADRTLAIEAPGSAGWRSAREEVKVTVVLAKRDINWKPPSTIVFGEAITTASLAATASEGGGNIRITKPAKGQFAVAGSGQQLEVQLDATPFYAAATKTATVDVTKVEPTIEWKEPKSIVSGTELSATQLNAKVTPAWLSPPIYEPKRGTTMATAGTFYLRADCKATRNSVRARKEVRLRVHDNAQKQLGYESMRNGSTWKKPTAGPAKVLADRWENDDGTDEDGIKTQGQRLMSDLATMTPDELKTHLNSLTTAANRSTSGTTYPNEIWKFPNGLQVRYKRNGDQYNPGVPMFCMEARTTPGFSASQDDIAFKITAEGKPAAKSPSSAETSVPSAVSGATAIADYRDGTAQATHLRCRPKVDQEIDWSDPEPITAATPLSDTQLCATLVEGDGALTYETGAGVALSKGHKLRAGNGQVLVAKAAGTARYKPARKTVHIDVSPAS